MEIDDVKSRICRLPIVAAWPQMREIVGRVTHKDLISVWEHPVTACSAVGGGEGAALPAAAAVLCSVISIHLVDDMLDDDPRGDYRILGSGPAANLGLAFQAAGHLLLEQAAAPAEVRAALQASFAEMSLATCYGQNLDARELASEQEYWRVVESKTPPLFGEALRMGALLGGAPPAVADRLSRLGRVLGRFIQVSDDLGDALRDAGARRLEAALEQPAAALCDDRRACRPGRIPAAVGAGRRSGRARRGATDPVSQRRGQLLHAENG